VLELPPLYDGRILRRYKRFLADVELPGKGVVTAHCPNTGSMQGCWEPGAPVQLSASDNPKRKLGWTLERVDMGAGWVGVNTSRVNQIIRGAFEHRLVSGLEHYTSIRPEPKYDVAEHGRSRFDFLLQVERSQDCYVEVKNTTLLRDGRIEFPDAVTSRGRKHLQLLQHAVARGCRGIILFAVNRPEGDRFSVARDIDPDYHAELLRSIDRGVEAIALRLRHEPDRVVPGETLPLDLG